jgi:hypothetical protein
MRFTSRLTVLAAAAAMTVGATVSAHAGLTDIGAFTQYVDAVTSDTTFSISAQPPDNITCDPAAVVDGRMINPRAGVVVGEVYGQAEIVAHWKCASLDTGKAYTVTGTVTDMYYSAGAYRAGASFRDNFGAVEGAATVNPRGVVSYVGGSAALNTWHYAHFAGVTSTGRHVATNSQLFYVAGV